MRYVDRAQMKRNTYDEISLPVPSRGARNYERDPSHLPSRAQHTDITSSNTDEVGKAAANRTPQDIPEAEACSYLQRAKY